MKRSGRLTVLVCAAFVTLLFLPGLVREVRAEEDGSKAAVKKESGGTSSAKDFSEEKADFKRKAKEKIAELDKKIGELEVKAKEAGSKAKAEGKKGLQELRGKRAVLKKDMEKLEASGKKTWEAAKQKVNDALDDLEKTYDKVVSYFKSE